MLKTLTLTLLAVACFAADEKPNPAIEKVMTPAIADAGKAYASYKQALEKVNEKTIKELERVKASAMSKKDLETANLADTKIKELKEGAMELLAKGSADELAAMEPREITIPATSNGIEIMAKKGQTIALQYISGKWIEGPGYTGMVNPDASDARKDAKIQIVNPDFEGTVLPAGTAKKPFVYAVTKDGAYLVRITDYGRADNAGSVVYKIVVK